MGIGVLDGPMIGARPSAKSNDLALVPWVRILRHEYLDSLDIRHRSKLFAFDIVHKEFLEQYIEQHLLPFAEAFAGLATKHQDILVTGSAFVSGMRKNSWRHLDQRLQLWENGMPVQRDLGLGLWV